MVEKESFSIFKIILIFYDSLKEYYFTLVWQKQHRFAFLLSKCKIIVQSAGSEISLDSTLSSLNLQNFSVLRLSFLIVLTLT